MQTDLKIEELEYNKDMDGKPILGKYDLGVVKLISQVFAGSVILAPYQRAFDLFISQQKDSLKFPFISLFPNDGYKVNFNNFAASKVGMPYYRQAKIYDDDTLSYKGQSPVMQNFAQFVYFDIPYQIDCWGTDRLSTIQLVQELFFWLNSQGQIKVKYSDKEFNSNLTMDSTIIDNSSYIEYADIGNLYRFTFSIMIEAPVIRTTNYLNLTKGELTIDMKEES